jgi:YwiC-like protein
MAEDVSQLATLSSGRDSHARLRSLIVPREHGAWGMLLVPLATGAAVGLLAGGNISSLPLLVVATIAIFWLRTPLESWLGTSLLRAQSPEERSAVARIIFLLATVAGIPLAGLFWGGRNRELLLLGLVATLAFVVQGAAKKISRKTRMLAQIVGAVGLTSTAPAAYCVVAGHVSHSALLLWLSNWLFAVNQIQFVQLRIHSTRLVGMVEKLMSGRAFLITQSVVACMLCVAWRTGILSGFVLLAFVPALVRGIAWFVRAPSRLIVRRLGWTELAHAVTFGILFVIAVYLHS